MTPPPPINSPVVHLSCQKSWKVRWCCSYTHPRVRRWQRVRGKWKCCCLWRRAFRVAESLRRPTTRCRERSTAWSRRSQSWRSGWGCCPRRPCWRGWPASPRDMEVSTVTKCFAKNNVFCFFLTYCHLAVIFFQVLPVQAKQSAFSSDTNTACRGFGAVVSLFSAVSIAQKQLKRMLFILTKHNVQSFGVIPFFKLQNYT